jgi:hypothetical protein
MNTGLPAKTVYNPITDFVEDDIPQEININEE